jgi:hypothetical protein
MSTRRMGLQKLGYFWMATQAKERLFTIMKKRRHISINRNINKGQLQLDSRR